MAPLTGESARLLTGFLPAYPLISGTVCQLAHHISYITRGANHVAMSTLRRRNAKPTEAAATVSREDEAPEVPEEAEVAGIAVLQGRGPVALALLM